MPSCAACGRYLIEAKHWRQLGARRVPIGPKCWQREERPTKPAEPWPPTLKRVRIFDGHRRRRGDPRQIDLFGGTA